MRDVAYIALGSNLGDRDAYLHHGREAIAELAGGRLLGASTIEETAPLGPPDQGAYLNQMVAIDTDLSPDELLSRLLNVERAEGRVRGERWGPRTLDLDIVCYERRTANTPVVRVPHPELPNRPFWQRELAELRTVIGEELALPSWARVTPARRAHIMRVTSLLVRWADHLQIPAEERIAWRDAGRLHDALRDATDSELQALVPGAAHQRELFHGPVAATVLQRDGETRRSVLDAVRYHTVGHAEWDRTGKALYMADFLEPGRSFARSDRAFLADSVTRDFDGVFRQVVRSRLEWALLEGYSLHPETVALWNAVR